MKFEKITIIGMGLIGGSLASALKKSNQVANVAGIDINSDSLSFALSKGIIDDGRNEIDNVVSDSDIVVIATYVESIPDISSQLAEFLTAKTVVTDVGSVKSSVIKKVNELVDAKFEFIGGHPIAGTENSGVRSSFPDLFRGKKCILTPSEEYSQDALNKVKDLWMLCGSKTFIMTPQKHDKIFSYVSHLPHIIAYSLISTVGSVDSEENIFDYAGGGLRDFTRIAASSPDMWTSIFLGNKEELLKSISEFKIHLEKLETAINCHDSEGIKKILYKSKDIKINN